MRQAFISEPLFPTGGRSLKPWRFLFAPLHLIPSLICVYPQPPEYPLRIQIAARCAGHSADQGAEHADADDPP